MQILEGYKWIKKLFLIENGINFRVNGQSKPAWDAGLIDEEGGIISRENRRWMPE